MHLTQVSNRVSPESTEGRQGKSRAETLKQKKKNRATKTRLIKNKKGTVLQIQQKLNHYKQLKKKKKVDIKIS